MTNQKILEIAMKQSAADLNCRAEEFLKNEPVVDSGGSGRGSWPCSPATPRWPAYGATGGR